MELRHALLNLLVVGSLVALTVGIPSSLLDEIKASEARNKKVKREHPAELLTTEENDDQAEYSKPSAIKRGTNFDLKSPLLDQSSLTDWDQDQSLFRSRNTLPSIPSSLYNSPENTYDDKTIAEYEKGFRYGSNKDRLDEAVENAVLKSELYGEPGAINQYRYYGAEDKKRKRREAKKLSLDSRTKREVDLSPEEILALLSLYENSRQKPAPSDTYRRPWNRYDQNLDMDLNQDDIHEQDEENWLDNPVYPHASHFDKELGPKYFPGQGQIYDNKDRWGGYADGRNKRFMVSKKRAMDPTRELRYLNGPNKNGYYTLTQLLSHQREPNVPVYHRLIL